MEKKPFPCTVCDKNFTQRPHLNTHIKDIHESNKLNKCDKCEASFATKVSLKTQIQTVHEGKKPLY